MAYRDIGILIAQYESMQKRVGYITFKAKNNLWNTGFHFGHWLFYSPDDDNDGKAAVTDKYLITQAFYPHSIQLLWERWDGIKRSRINGDILVPGHKKITSHQNWAVASPMPSDELNTPYG